MEEEEVNAFFRLQSDYQTQSVQFRIALNTLNFGQSAIQSLGLGGALIFAALAAVNGELSTGDFVLVNTYVVQLFMPMFVSHLFPFFSLNLYTVYVNDRLRYNA